MQSRYSDLFCASEAEGFAVVGAVNICLKPYYVIYSVSENLTLPVGDTLINNFDYIFYVD
jgi:hypothetical protein